MKKITLNTNSHPALSDEEILSKQDFHSLLQKNKVMKAQTSKPKKIYWVAAATIVVAILGVHFYLTKNEQPDSLTAKAFIQPPIPQADISYDYFTINVDKDTVITYKTGSKIIIPAHAFKNSNGELVEGNIQLSYREIKGITDIFLSGIPMEYDSAGQNFHFESAGMFDIGAKQNNENLQTNESALIDVKMTITNTEKRFNSYYLDTIAKKWVYLENRNIETIKKDTSPFNKIEEQRAIMSSTKPTEKEIVDETSVAKIENELKQIKKQIPLEPVKADNSKPIFNIEVDPKEFPEVAMYKNVQFQAVNTSEYISSKSQILWNDVRLEKTNKPGQYWVILSKADETYKIIGTPVLKDDDYDAAVKEYDKKFAAYEQKLEEKKAEAERTKKEMEERALAQKRAYEAYQAKVAAQEEANRQIQIKAIENQANQQMVYSTFQILRFGTYNNDCPQFLPRGADIVVSFKHPNGEDLNNLKEVYLVDKTSNTMFSYHFNTSSANSIKNFKYNPKNENLIWVVNKSNEIGIVTSTQFEDIVQNNNPLQNFTPKFIDRKFKNYEDVKKELEI